MARQKKTKEEKEAAFWSSWPGEFKWALARNEDPWTSELAREAVNAKALSQEQLNFALLCQPPFEGTAASFLFEPFHPADRNERGSRRIQSLKEFEYVIELPIAIINPKTEAKCGLFRLTGYGLIKARETGLTRMVSIPMPPSWFQNFWRIGTLP